jgi:hypothetical protein
MNTMPGIRSKRSGVAPVEGMWDFDGSCTPTEFSVQRTFSVACFQWVKMTKGKNLKRAKSVKRISGPTSDPEAVYAKAEAFCAAAAIN